MASYKLLKTPLILTCFVLVIFMMRQNNITPSRGLRHSVRLLTERILTSGSRPSTTLCDGIITEDSYSESEVEKAEKVGDSLSKTRGGNPLEDWVVNGSEDTFADDYAKGLVPFFAPWPVLFVISILTCFGFLMNWCCIYGCCKNCCKCCKCCHGPKEQKKMKIYIAISGLFLVGMLGSAAAGLVFAPKVSNGMNVTFCTCLISVENLVYGETSESWLGFNGILTSLYDVQSQFSTTVTNLNAIGGSQTNMNTAYNNAVTANSDLYTNNQGQTVTRADPDETTAYSPDYIANLGPVATSGTYTYLIKQELDNWKTTISSAITDIDNSITSLKSQQTAIADAIDAGIDTAQSITDSLNDVIDSLGDNGSTIKDAVKLVGTGLIALFAVNMAFSLIAIGSVGMVSWMKVKFFNKILHFSWCAINLMTVLAFLLATLTFPVSVVLVESCGVFDLTLNDQDFFNDVTDKIFSGGSSDAKSILNTCFYGSGLALDELGLTTDLSYFDTIYDQLDAVNDIIPLSGTYTNANPPESVVIPPQQTLVDETLDGEVADSTETVTDLKTLNKGTNSASYSCISLQDTWVLNSASCTDSSYYTFLSTDSDVQGRGSKVCIGFVDAWMSPSTKDIDNRYDTTYFPASCTNPSLTTVKALVTGFENNRDEINTLFTNVQTDLQNVADKQKLFSQEIVTFINSIQQVKSDVAALQDSLVGTTNGLIPNTNCKFIGSDLRKLQVAMCSSFVSSLYQSSVVMIVMGCMSLCATIFTFCLAKRFSLNKDKQVTPDNNNQVAKNDPFQDPFQDRAVN